MATSNMFNRVFSLISVFTFLAIIVGCGCGTQKKQETRQLSEQEYSDSLIILNKKRIKQESMLIDKYIERHKLEMTETGTGLRYMIYQHGQGETAKFGQYALVHFKVTLLDGTVCYSSEKNDPEEFKIGQDNVESGLHEGITYMKPGDKAKFILPPHLAHGLIGDNNKIPSNATIIYDVELLSVR